METIFPMANPVPLGTTMAVAPAETVPDRLLDVPMTPPLTACQ